MDREAAKNEVKHRMSDYLLQEHSIDVSKHKNFRCLNPDHEDKTPSMSYNSKTYKVHCFGKCNCDYDTFDLIAMDYGLSNDKDIFLKAYEYFGIDIDKEEAPHMKVAKTQKKEPVKPKQVNENDYKNKFKIAREALPNSPAMTYLKTRGISERVASNNWIGYEEKYPVIIQEKDGQTKYKTWRALIIPTGKSSYNARNIDSVSNLDKENRYRKKGPCKLFNTKRALYNDNPVFIVEGEIDAMSIEEAGGQAVALGSTSNINKLIDLLKEKPTNQMIIIALDNDESGNKAADELEKELKKLGILNYRPFGFYGVYKDANEALVNDRKALEKSIYEAQHSNDEIKEVVEDIEKAEYLKTNVASQVDNLIAEIHESVSNPPIDTGFSKLNEKLEGGLYEGLYIIGAVSSLGKTAFIMQLADQITKSGKDCLVFSMEMSRRELMARSISRNTYVLSSSASAAKGTRGILNGSKYENYSTEEKNLINKAIEEYKNNSSNLYIYEGVGDIGPKEITKIVKQHYLFTGHKPIVFIDYLQILAPSNERNTDKQNTDKAVVELKRLSRDMQIPVIAISSFNRDSYKTTSANKGLVSMADFKESGAIEYSSDILIGLQFKNAGSSNYNEDDEKRKFPRDICLKILKNRNGELGSCDFKFYPRYNYFKEVENQEDEKQAKTQNLEFRELAYIK